MEKKRRNDREEQLRQNEKNLREAQRLAHIGSWKWDIGSNTVEWSEEMYRINGRDPNSSAPNFAGLSSCYTPESWERLSEAVTTALQSGEPYELDLKIVRPDGAIRFTSAHGEADYDATGKIVGLHGTVQDITERKQAEDEIRRMALMLDIAPGSITIHDFDGRFLYANQRTFDLHGFNRDEFLALNLHQLDVPDSEKLIAPRMQELFDRGEATFQVAHNRKDGSTLLLEVNARVTAWGDKKVILSIANDITERKQAEERLCESEEHFRTAFEYSANGMCLTSPDGIFLSVNQAMSNMIGSPREDLIGRYFNEITHPDDFEIGKSAMRQMLSGEVPDVSFEKRYLRKNGETFWAHITVALLKDAYGQPLHFITQVEDIAGRKQAQEKILEQLSELKRWQQVMLGREDRVQELKQEVNDLCRRVNEPVRYPSQQGGLS